MSSPTVAIGLDGVAWHLLDPFLSSGDMPVLAGLKETGAWGNLRSTVPTYTPPAWTSAVTGVNPGRHGIYGFVEGHAQHDRQELMHSGKIKAPALWEIVNAQQVRAGIYNLPLTYPPRPLDGWMVSGMMTPGYGAKLKGFASPSELEPEILAWAPDYVVDVSANYEQDWRDAALCRRTLESLRQRETVLTRLLDRDPPGVVFSVLEAPDRLQHVYYRYMDPSDELYESAEGRAIRSELAPCFQAIDRIAGILVDYAGEDGAVVVCSDHGFTAWEVSVHLNALLADWGYLKLKPAARALQTPLARNLVPVAKRVLPRRVAREAKGKTFAAIDWNRTRAFASPIPQQGIFVNLKGREPRGIVPQEDLAAITDDLEQRFMSLTAPDGGLATDVVHRADDVFHGEAREGAPDILPVLRDHRFELDDELFHRDPFTDLSHLPRGVHHPDGIVVVRGPGTAKARISGSVMDVLPTLLYMAGCKVPEGLDGKVLVDAFDDDHMRDRPIETTAPISSSDKQEASPYSEEEEAVIEESLRGLGYL